MKRGFGYLLVAIAIFLTLGFVIAVLPVSIELIKMRGHVQVSSGYDIGYITGVILSGLAYAGITVFIGWLGKKWIKAPKKKVNV